MSGGSLNYLYCKSTNELFEEHSLRDMEEVEIFLIRNGYNDIAKDVRRLIEYVRSAQNRIVVLQDRLEDVFHAVEWYMSADYGDDALRKHMDEYRND